MNESLGIARQLFRNGSQVVYDSVGYTRIKNETDTEIHPSIIAACTTLMVINVLIGTPANILVCVAVALNK